MNWMDYVLNGGTKDERKAAESDYVSSHICPQCGVADWDAPDRFCECSPWSPTRDGED